MFLVTDLPPVAAYEMVLPAAPTAELLLASTSAHLKTLKVCAPHHHWVKGVCTPYVEWMMAPPPPPPAKKS